MTSVERRTRQWVVALSVPAGLFVLVAVFTWSHDAAWSAWITSVVAAPAWIGTLLSKDRPGRAAGMSLLASSVLVVLSLVLFPMLGGTDSSDDGRLVAATFYGAVVPGIIISGLVSAALAALFVGDPPIAAGSGLRGTGLHRRSR